MAANDLAFLYPSNSLVRPVLYFSLFTFCLFSFFLFLFLFRFRFRFLFLFLSFAFFFFSFLTLFGLIPFFRCGIATGVQYNRAKDSPPKRPIKECESRDRQHPKDGDRIANRIEGAHGCRIRGIHVARKEERRWPRRASFLRRGSPQATQRRKEGKGSSRLGISFTGFDHSFPFFYSQMLWTAKFESSFRRLSKTCKKKGITWFELWYPSCARSVPNAMCC